MVHQPGNLLESHALDSIMVRYGTNLPWYQVPGGSAPQTPRMLGAGRPPDPYQKSPWSPWDLVQWTGFHDTMVPWYNGTMVPWYHGTTYHGTMVLWYHGTMVPWLAMVPW